MSGEPAPARRLGKYELQTRLGDGGMAVVWKAFDPQLQRHVAIKLMRAELRHDPDFLVRFEREAQLIASLNHPNIIKIHDFRISEPPESETTTAYMVMDYVQGQTLADYIRNTSRKGSIPSWEDILYLFAVIGRALDHAHQKGMIHRDIKPANILLDSRPALAKAMGEPILTDFGIARVQGVQTGTVIGSFIGTPNYTSPEQALGQRSDYRCDLYSLGVILYEITTGLTPFRGDTAMAIVMQHVHELPAPPTLLNPYIPPAVSAIILKSMSKRPEDRYTSATAMATALAQALHMPMPSQQHARTIPNPPSNPNPTGGEYPVPLLNTRYPGQTSPERARPVHMTPVRPLLGTEYQPSLVNTPELSSSMRDQPPALAAVSIPSTNNPPAIQQIQPRFKRISRRSRVIIACLLLVLLMATLGTAIVIASGTNGNTGGTGGAGKTATANPVVGQVTFSKSASTSHYDQIQIDLHTLPAPPTGDVYYAWLVTNTLENSPARWQLTYKNGNAHLDKQSYPNHPDLLTANTLFLVTKETTANGPPDVPDTTPAARLYYAQITSSSQVVFNVRPCPTNGASNVCNS